MDERAEDKEVVIFNDLQCLGYIPNTLWLSV